MIEVGCQIIAASSLSAACFTPWILMTMNPVCWLSLIR
jgi:hypothetical protein